MHSLVYTHEIAHKTKHSSTSTHMTNAPLSSIARLRSTRTRCTPAKKRHHLARRCLNAFMACTIYSRVYAHIHMYMYVCMYSRVHTYARINRVGLYHRAYVQVGCMLAGSWLAWPTYRKLLCTCTYTCTHTHIHTHHIQLRIYIHIHIHIYS